MVREAKLSPWQWMAPARLLSPGDNTYSGGTYINGGVLSISSDSNLGAVSVSNITIINCGGTLQADGDVALDPSRVLEIGNGAIVDVTVGSVLLCSVRPTHLASRRPVTAT